MSFLIRCFFGSIEATVSSLQYKEGTHFLSMKVGLSFNTNINYCALEKEQRMDMNAELIIPVGWLELCNIMASSHPITFSSISYWITRLLEASGHGLLQLKLNPCIWIWTSAVWDQDREGNTHVVVFSTARRLFVEFHLHYCTLRSFASLHVLV